MVLQLTGHTDYTGAEGNIVCAAVSMLAHTMIAWINSPAALTAVEKINALRWQSGEVLLDTSITNEGRALALGAFGAVLGGLRLLAEKYPQNVQMGGNKENSFFTIH